MNLLRRTFCWMMLALLGAAPALAQDAKAVIAETSKAMGLDGVTSLYYYGSGAQYSLGQNNNANMPWPKTPVNAIHPRHRLHRQEHRAPPGPPSPSPSPAVRRR